MPIIQARCGYDLLTIDLREETYSGPGNVRFLSGQIVSPKPLPKHLLDCVGRPILERFAGVGCVLDARFAIITTHGDVRSIGPFVWE